jgi:glycosyltransferase involved in cell wall biosynthesis
LPDVVLPCLDEAGALPWVLSRMPEGFHAIVADNGSTDGSPDIARAHGATVVDARPKGFGAACHAGLMAATADVVCFMDADGSLDPQQLHRVVDGLDTADLVLGRRRPTERGAFAPHARLGNLEVARRVRRKTGFDLHDLGPMRAGNREALISLGIEDRRSGYPLEMVVRAGRAGWTVTEVAVDYLPRTGRSKVTGTVGGTLRAVKDMSRVLREP